MALITHFDLNPALVPPLQECQDSYEIGDPNAEWPNNVISTRARVYENGAILREGATPDFRVDPNELALVRRLSQELADAMQGVEVGMLSEASSTFHPFFITANEGDPVSSAITEEFLRAKFGGTIFPPANITIEPLKAGGIWWEEAISSWEDEDEDWEDEEESLSDKEERPSPYHRLIENFQSQPEIKNPVFIRIGDYSTLRRMDKKLFPPGTEMPGSVFPRLAVGLTERGSLVGLFGVSVQT
jgi:hypothetical protein